MVYSPVQIDFSKSSEPVCHNVANGKIDYVEDFLTFCQRHRSLSENTIYSYRWDLGQWFKWLRDRDLEATEIKIKEIDDFIISLTESGRGGRTINRKMSCLKMFYSYLCRIEAIRESPMKFMKNSKEPKRLPRYLSKGEQEALLRAADNGDHPHGKSGQWLRNRDRLMVILLLDCGLRISELCNIRKRDILLEEGILRIVGKGNREREVVLSNRAIALIKECFSTEKPLTIGQAAQILNVHRDTLREWDRNKNFSPERNEGNQRMYTKYDLREISHRKNRQPCEIKIDESDGLDYLFRIQGNGEHLGTRHAFRILKSMGKRAGIENLHPHLLRHSFASNLRRKGGDLLLIKEALGHTSVSSTEIYAHIGNEGYKEKLRSLIN